MAGKTPAKPKRQYKKKDKAAIPAQKSSSKKAQDQSENLHTPSQETVTQISPEEKAASKKFLTRKMMIMQSPREDALEKLNYRLKSEKLVLKNDRLNIKNDLRELSAELKDFLQSSDVTPQAYIIIREKIRKKEQILEYLKDLKKFYKDI